MAENRDKRFRSAATSSPNRWKPWARATQGQQVLNGLYQSVEASLQLAQHAETWEWKEVEKVTVT
jgi:hypothetical protein